MADHKIKTLRDFALGFITKTATVGTAMEIIPDQTGDLKKIGITFLVAIITQIAPDVIKFIKNKLNPKSKRNGQTTEIKNSSLGTTSGAAATGDETVTKKEGLDLTKPAL